MSVIKSFLAKYSKVGIVAHSAGGANIIASLVKREGLYNKCIFFLEGPAVKIFKRNFPNLKNESNLDIISNLGEESIIITGTSGLPDWERKALKKGESSNICTLSILDHWSNFRIRFLPQDLWNSGVDLKSFLPKYVWVVDDEAYHKALKERIPEEILLQIYNPYLEELKEIFRNKKEDNLKNIKNRILFIGEYFSIEHPDLSREHASKLAFYSEFDFIESILAEIQKIKIPECLVTIRLHPSESKKKYDYLLEEYNFIRISSSDDLIDDLIDNEIILGRTSMALFIAGYLGLRSYALENSNLPLLPRRKYVTNISNILQLYKLSNPF